MAVHGATTAHVVWMVGRGVFLEVLRRKDLYVLGILMLLFALGVWAMRMAGIENGATGTFLLNLGLTLASLAAHVLTLLLAARQMPVEIEQRTLHLLLARPVERHALLLGKWLACTACGVVVFMVLFLVGWLPVPRLESYAAATLVQALLLQAVSLGMLSALAIACSLLLPRSLALVCAGGLFLLGGRLVTFMGSAADPTYVRAVGAWLGHYLPDFSKLNLITRYTDGMGALGWPDLAALGLYGVLFIACSLALAVWRFQRRAI